MPFNVGPVGKRPNLCVARSSQSVPAQYVNYIQCLLSQHLVSRKKVCYAVIIVLRKVSFL